MAKFDVGNLSDDWAKITRTELADIELFLMIAEQHAKNNDLENELNFMMTCYTAKNGKMLNKSIAIYLEACSKKGVDPYSI